MHSESQTRIDGLDRLSKLLEAGHIDQQEFDQLKADLLAKPNQERPTTSHGGPHTHEPSGTPAFSMTEERATTSPSAEVASQTANGAPTVYKVAFGLGIASVFFGGTFGLLAWATVALGGYALYKEKHLDRRWMAWTGLALGIMFSFMNAYLNGHLDSFSLGTPAIDESATLGVDLDTVVSRWNENAERSNNRIDEMRPLAPGIEDTHVARFDDKGNGWTSLSIHNDPDNGDEIYSLFLRHDGEVSSFDDFLERSRLLCVAVYGRESSARCIEKTTDELGVTNGEWVQGDYEAEYIEHGFCWQLRSSGSSIALIGVDAVGRSTSECRF